MNYPKPNVILLMPDLCAYIKKSAAWVNNKKNVKSRYFDPSFPQPIKFGNRRNSSIGWPIDAIDAWLNRKFIAAQKSMK